MIIKLKVIQPHTCVQRFQSGKTSKIEDKNQNIQRKKHLDEKEINKEEKILQKPIMNIPNQEKIV